jgi:hypothetical protein
MLHFHFCTGAKIEKQSKLAARKVLSSFLSSYISEVSGICLEVFETVNAFLFSVCSYNPDA